MKPVQSNCSNINISIVRPDGNIYVTEDEVLKMISYFCKTERVFSEDKLSAIESFLLKNKSVQHCEVYTDINGRLNVTVTQCYPMGRIINVFGDSFYMDKSGKLIPAVSGRPARVIVINGEIKDQFSSVDFSIPNDSLFKTTIMDDIYLMLLQIEEKQFLKKMIQQVYIDSLSQIVLIPVIGPHEILMGPAEHIAGKLNKLELFYKKSMNSTQWKNYSSIDLRFKNQIVCKSYSVQEPVFQTDSLLAINNDSININQQLNTQIN